MEDIRGIFTLVWKDLLHELRTKEVAVSVLVFSLTIIVLFHFAFQSVEDALIEHLVGQSAAIDAIMRLISGGILWVTFAFAGVLSQNRTFALEKEQGCLHGLMLCPVDRSVIYIGKMLSSLLYMLFIEIIMLPVFFILFDLNFDLMPKILAIAVVATIGFTAVGTLFSAIAANTKSRDIMLPILFYPIIIPVLILAVIATEEVFDGSSWGNISMYLGGLALFGVIFTVVSILVFEYVLEE